MAVCIMLIFYSAIALYMGTGYFLRERKRGTEQYCMLMGGILVFIWCFGYGIMGLCHTPENCYFWRGVALFGVVFFMVNEIIFVRHFTGSIKKYFGIVLFFLIIGAAVVFWMVIQPDVVEFFEYNGRMAYSGHPCPARTVQGVYTAGMVIAAIVMCLIMLKKVRFRRIKRVIRLIIVAHLAIVVLALPDTVFPIMGMVSVPSSGFGAFICYFFIMYVVDRQSAFELSLSTINEYIYRSVDSSFLFFDYKGRLLRANAHAKDYLHLSENDTPMFNELFEASDEDMKKILSGDNVTTTGEGIGVSVKNTDMTCSLSVTKINDKYGDPICYACMVNDITSEAKMFEEINKMKDELDEELKVKTREIELLSLQTIETMANTIEAKDDYTKGHSTRVSEYSVLIARKLGWNEQQVEELRIMALLHDIGKISIPDRVLNKPGRLEDAEFEIIKSHTSQGYNILKSISSLEHISNVARHHHERYDGKGYPDRISGEDIEFEARIVGIADSYDAMSSDRIYRKALPKDVIRNELVKGRGTQFDPELLDIFLEMFDNGEVDVEVKEISTESNTLNLSEFLTDIANEGVHEGASTLTHQELVKLYSYLESSNLRYGSSFRVLMITLDCVDEKKFNQDHLLKAMEAMEYSIVQCLRKTDLTSRVSDSQQIIVLTEVDENYISEIMDRIFAGYYKHCLYTELKPIYEIN